MRTTYRFDVNDTKTGDRRFALTPDEVAQMCNSRANLILGWVQNKLNYGMDEELVEGGCMYRKRYLIRRYIPEDQDEKAEKWISSTWSKERFSEEWEQACAPFLRLQNRRDIRMSRIRKGQAVRHG